jgi:hypothetical protein
MGVEGKRYLIGTLFPEKLEFNRVGYRTPLMNKAAELIYLKTELRAKKWGKNHLK